MIYILFINRDIHGIYNDESLAQQALKKYKDWVSFRSGKEIIIDNPNLFSFFFGWEEVTVTAAIIKYPLNTPFGILKDI